MSKTYVGCVCGKSFEMEGTMCLEVGFLCPHCGIEYIITDEGDGSYKYDLKESKC